MADLLEIVLEDISRSKVCPLLLILLGHAEHITEIRCSEEIKLSSDTNISEEEIKYFLSLMGDASLIIKLSSLNMADCKIPSVLLRLLKYGDRYDIDFNFDESDVADIGATGVMKKLQEYFTKLGEAYKVGNWFGGIEPASDENTRYFTGNELGPLH